MAKKNPETPAEMVEHMVRLAQRGLKPSKVVESTLSFHPGSSAQVNKDTTAVGYQSNETLSVAKNTLVTIVGIGAGPSGVDHHVRLPDGKQVVIPFYDLNSSPTS